MFFLTIKSDEQTKKLVAKDEILQNLLKVAANEKEIITKHYFHDALLSDKGSNIKTEENTGSRNGTPRKKQKVGDISGSQR